MRAPLVLVLLSWLLVCCGDDAGGDAGTAGVCPDAISETRVWTYDGEDETCAAIAEALNEDDGDEACEGESSSFELRESGDECTAELAQSCDGRTVEITCDVQRDGDADCEAEINAPELPDPCVLQGTAR